MFNKTTIHRTEVTPVTRVIEKSISPDKVTDIYKEVKKEIEDTILRTFVFEDTPVKGVVVETSSDYNQRIRNVLIRFTVNDHEVIEKFTIPASEEIDKHAAYGSLVEAFQTQVMKMVIRVAYPNI